MNTTKQRPLDGLFYLVLSDLFGSSESSQANGNAFAAVRVEIFERAAVKALNDCGCTCSHFSGYFVKRTGDAVLLIFRHFPDIIEWHMNFLGELLINQRQTGALRARTCVHVGEVRFDKDDVSGAAVEQVFKMEAQAKIKRDELAGILLISQEARTIANPTLYNPQCSIEESPIIDAGNSRLYRLLSPNGNSGIAFLINKNERDEKLDGLLNRGV